MSDWLTMCDNDFSSADLSKMQQQLFCALDFNLGAPLSYRFLRRYARVNIPNFTATQRPSIWIPIGWLLGQYKLGKSYFLQACSIDMDLLTLARYILESSLLNSHFSSESDSKLASAALWLASCMSKAPKIKSERVALWTSALQHYSG